MFGIDIATFLVSLATLGMMRAVPPPPDAERPSLRRIAEGFSYANRGRSCSALRDHIVAMFFGMPNALFPAFALEFGGPGVLGLSLRGAPGGVAGRDGDERLDEEVCTGTAWP